MAELTVRLEDGVKAEAERLFAELGMDIATAVTFFIRQTLRQRKIPFTIEAESAASPCPAAEEPEPDWPDDDPDNRDDPFYSEENMKWLRESIGQGKQGKYIVKTIEELEAMADG